MGPSGLAPLEKIMVEQPLPEALRDKVWSLAWEAGHYAGLSEVYCVYGKYADLAELAFEAGIKSTR
jgi:hypothetical protein